MSKSPSLIKPTVLCASDLLYFKEHGLAFCRSAAKAKHPVASLVSGRIGEDIQVEAKSLVEFMQTDFKTKISPEEGQYIMKPMVLPEPNISPEDVRAYYASMRFIFLPDLLASTEQAGLLVLDIDSIIRKTVVLPNNIDVGLFLREDNEVGSNDYEKTGMKVAAGALYVANTPLGQEFATKVRDYLLSHPFRWFCDQHAIYSTYLEMKDRLRIMKFDQNLIDWEFNEDSFIWSGKGSRKFTSDQYKIEKARFED